MKKIAVLLTIVLSLGAFNLSYTSGADNISVTYNGNHIAFDQAPVIIDGRTLVPLRAIFEDLGAEVEWDPYAKQIMSIKGDMAVLMTVNSKTMTAGIVGGTPKDTVLDTAPTIINGRTMVPMRAIAEAFSCTVNWDGNTKTISIYSSDFDNVISDQPVKETVSEPITEPVKETASEPITEPETEPIKEKPSYDNITQTAIKGYSTIPHENHKNLIDGKNNTKWCVTHFKEAFLIWETSDPVSIIGYTIVTGNDNSKYPGRNPGSWTLYGCNAGSAPERESSDWEIIETKRNDRSLPDANFAHYDYELSSASPEYNYFKLEVTGTRGADTMQMSEFELIFAGSNHNFNSGSQSTVSGGRGSNSSAPIEHGEQICDDCGGRGMVRCHLCGGTGKGMPMYMLGQRVEQGCTACGSTGQVVCGNCGGSGRK